MPDTKHRPQTRWDSWPPTQMRLRPSLEHDDAEIDELDIAIDEDPIHYFLTPATPSYEDDIDMLDFDAGIEDAKHPVPIIRSVSPSSLEGLRLPPPRPPTPPKSPSIPELDIDMMSTPDDDEDYIHFSGGQSPGLGAFRSRDYSSSRSTGTESSTNPNSHQGLLTASRGRDTMRPGPRPLGPSGYLRGHSRSLSSRQSQHSWREPSPDVWSIEEEAEQDPRVDVSDDGIVKEGQKGKMVRAKTINVSAAKPKKKVRFVLPAREATE